MSSAIIETLLAVLRRQASSIDVAEVLPRVVADRHAEYGECLPFCRGDFRIRTDKDEDQPVEQRD